MLGRSVNNELERMRKEALLVCIRFLSWYLYRGTEENHLSQYNLSPLGIFLFTTASRIALRPTQPPIQWVPGALSLRVKRPGRETDHSPPSSAEVKECVQLYVHSPNTPSWRGAHLKKKAQG